LERSYNTEVKLQKDLEDQDSEKSKRKGKGSLGIALRKQNKTKQNKTKQNKTKQNKNKQTNKTYQNVKHIHRTLQELKLYQLVQLWFDLAL